MIARIAIIFALMAATCFAEAKPFDEQPRNTQNLFKRYAKDFIVVGEKQFYVGVWIDSQTRRGDQYESNETPLLFDPTIKQGTPKPENAISNASGEKIYNQEVTYIKQLDQGYFVLLYQNALASKFIVGDPPKVSGNGDHEYVWIKKVEGKKKYYSSNGNVTDIPMYKEIDVLNYYKHPEPEQLFQYYIDHNLSEFPRFQPRRKDGEWTWINRPLKVRIEEVEK